MWLSFQPNHAMLGFLGSLFSGRHQRVITKAVNTVQSPGSDEANFGVLRPDEDDPGPLSQDLEELHAVVGVNSPRAVRGIRGNVDAAKALRLEVHEKVSGGVVSPQTEGCIVDGSSVETGHLHVAQEALGTEEPGAVNNCWQ